MDFCRWPHASKQASRAQEVQRLLAQLIAHKGFVTNPDTPGAEKLCVAAVSDAWLLSPRAKFDPVDGDCSLLEPQCTFVVKGFNRASCALAVLRCAFECPDFLEAGLVSVLETKRVGVHRRSFLRMLQRSPALSGLLFDCALIGRLNISP